MRPYSLIRTRRKTVAIHITQDAAVQVRAPLGMPRAEIERLLAGKEAWIAKHTDAQETRNKACADYTPDYGGTARLCGADYPIRARAGSRAGFDAQGFYLPPDHSPARVREMLISVYKKEAGNLLRAKTAQFSARMGVTPAQVTITSAKTRWGACSENNRLSFSWRLILLDEAAIDYVVVHELAHITQHNHSPRFWAVVAAVLPDYKTRQAIAKHPPAAFYAL